MHAGGRGRRTAVFGTLVNEDCDQPLLFIPAFTCRADELYLPRVLFGFLRVFVCI